MKKLILFQILFIQILFSQKTPDTLNLAKWNDKFILHKDINENSGLSFYDDYLFTFNDSGGKSEVYLIDPNVGEITSTIKLENVKNQDWEAISNDGKSIYIGEFGNNKGMRKNLKIFKFSFPKNLIDTLNIVKADSINFSFKNQTNFDDIGWRATNFDCEAMVYYKNKLHIFTKEWTDYKVTHYILDLNKKSQELSPVENFYVGCVITDAAIVDNELHLVGYDKEGVVKYWKFYDITENKMFTDKNKETILGFAPAIGQIEGITIDKKSNKIFISGEEISVGDLKHPQVLYVLPYK